MAERWCGVSRGSLLVLVLLAPRWNDNVMCKYTVLWLPFDLLHFHMVAETRVPFFSMCKKILYKIKYFSFVKHLIHTQGDCCRLYHVVIVCRSFIKLTENSGLPETIDYIWKVNEIFKSYIAHSPNTYMLAYITHITCITCMHKREWRSVVTTLSYFVLLYNTMS